MYPPSVKDYLNHRKVRFGDVTYDYYVTLGNSALQSVYQRLKDLDADRFVIVADQGLTPAAIREIEHHFREFAPTVVLAAQACEKDKSLGTIDELAERAIQSGVTRRSVVVALGGGIVGNVAGLLAGLLFRGIRLIHVPTTLLSMSDSVLSLKQAVNSRLGKNHLGVFHPPILVWSRIEFMDTLPVEEIQSALCEMIKNVLAICPERYDEIAAKLRPDGRYSAAVLADFIDLCIEAKVKVMCDDHLEKQDGLVLEYGHTIGHAAELLSEGKLRHGFAIGVGMLAAARISRLLGYLSESDEAAHAVLLERNGSPTTLPAYLDIEAIMHKVRFDNKRGYVRSRAGYCDFVLLDGLGRPHYDDKKLITSVDEDIVRAGVSHVMSQV
ncbi:2-deoxy-scyllo-inosose synthase [Pseudoduganella rivuli]|nr:2-deoxy-scyllo-inosose synthase [Pseudoduganella rivuli]